FMAKIELFRGLFGWVPPAWGAFPVRRFDRDGRAMLTAERKLRAGEVVGMFPEGTRSRSGEVGKPHPGTALIALRTGATRLPCGTRGCRTLSTRVVHLRRPASPVRTGKPITVEARRKPTAEAVRAPTPRIVAEVRALLPPSYGGTYTG